MTTQTLEHMPALVMDEAGTAARGRLRPGEVLLFAIGSLLFLIVQVCLTNPAVLLGRPLWLDEYLTHLIVSDPSISHSVAAVRGGVDTNPPVFHLMLRGFVALAGGASPAAYRVFALLSVWIAIVATYAGLRSVFAVLPALIGAAMVWDHALVIANAFEARFYGPMLALTAILCALLAIGRWKISAVLMAVAAALLCTIHYFGIFVLACIVAGEMIRGRKARDLLPMVCGPVALLGFMPFVMSQRQGLSVVTWVEPTTLGQMAETLWRLLPAAELGVLIGLSAVWRVMKRQDASRDKRETVRRLAGFFGLLLLPVVVLLFSLLMQPAFRPRYLVPALLALAPVGALLSRRLSMPFQFIVLIGLLGLSWTRLYGFAFEQQVQQSELQGWISESRLAELPVVVGSRQRAYEMQAAAPDLRDRLWIMDLRAVGAIELTAKGIYELDMAAKVQRFYAVPRLADAEKLRELGRFRLSGEAAELGVLRRHLPLFSGGSNVFEVDQSSRFEPR